GEDAWPRSFEWRGRTHPVKEMCRRWRVDEGWWRSRIWREYFKLVTATGLLVVIYRDKLTDRWYLSRLYD
ncbi:MAG: hypothetical protein U9R11_02940, partial [Chloroflexota bacterium]|nr:hypothetical protein [Chloroflexota bacterium]